MTAAALRDEREDLAQWAAVILAPEFLHHHAAGRDRQARALLHNHTRHQLHALAVVLADRASGRKTTGKGPAPDARLIRATRAANPRRVHAILTPLTRRALHDLCLTLAGLVHDPDLRPEDGLVDDVAVHRAADGHPVLLTRVERDLAILLLARRGHGPTDIQTRLGLTPGVVIDVLYKRPPVQLDLLEGSR